MICLCGTSRTAKSMETESMVVATRGWGSRCLGTGFLRGDENVPKLDYDGDFPGGPVVKTPHSQYGGGHGFNPSSGD